MNPERPIDAHTTNSHFWLQITLLIGFIFCLVIGGGALAALLLIQDQPETPAPPTALTALPTERISPRRALERLAGGPGEALAYQAIQAGELDLALIFTAYDTSLDDHNRLALLLSIGRRYPAAQDPERAAAVNQTLARARAIAVLSPRLPSFERAQSLGQIAEILARLSAPSNTLHEAMALDAAYQAIQIVENAPDLLPAQRSQILETLARVARQLEHAALEAEVDSLARNPYITPDGTLFDSRWGSLSEPVPVEPEIRDAAALRTQAARALVDRLIATGGVDYEAERQALATALLAEDQTRRSAYQDALAAGLPLPQQMYWVQEQRKWVALKLQVAHHAFGISILPEWEANTEAITQELASLNANMMNVLDAMDGALTEPVEQSMLRTEALLWLALQGELGLDSGRIPEDLSDNLRFSQLELTEQGTPPALPVLYRSDSVPPGFRIVELEELQ